MVSIMAVMLYGTNFYVHGVDTDLKDKLRPASVFSYFQDAASVHAVNLGVAYHEILDLNLYWVILYEEFEKFKDAAWGDIVKTRTWPKSRTRLEFERQYELRNKSDELLVKVISTWCEISTETRKLERADSVVFKGEYYDDTNYPEMINRKTKFTITEPDMTNDYKVLYTDLDHNLHLNITKYLDVLYNMHASQNRVKKVRISFVNESHVGEIIHILYKHTEEGDCYIVLVGANTCFMAILETEE
jgi:acyl-ACP thioesterase